MIYTNNIQNSENFSLAVMRYVNSILNLESSFLAVFFIALALIVSVLIISRVNIASALTGLIFMPVPDKKCQKCLKEGKTIWVITGKNCPVCGTTAERSIVNMHKINGSILVSGLMVMMYILSINIESIFELLDAPRPWGLYFQDSASPQMEALVELHNNIMFYLVIILFSVGWILASAVSKFRLRKSGISNKYVSHGTLVELIWTITPGLILILIAFTSFKLLYLMDEVSDTNMTLYIEGHQWYWSYQYPDFVDEEGEFIEYDSYLVPDSDLDYGALRMLDVDERVVVPEISHTRLAIASGDVIHSYACPALAIKADAYPGRLNQASALINRVGVFYGQCSELCGLLHSSMPISIQCVSLEKFLIYLWEK